MESFTSVAWVFLIWLGVFLEVDGTLENIPNSSNVSHFAVLGCVFSVFNGINKLTDTK